MPLLRRTRGTSTAANNLGGGAPLRKRDDVHGDVGEEEAEVYLRSRGGLVEAAGLLLLLLLLLLLEVATLLLEDRGGAAATGSSAACSGVQTPEGPHASAWGIEMSNAPRGGRVGERDAQNETCEMK